MVQLQGCILNADYMATPLSACMGSTITFTNMSTGTTATSTYAWNFGSGATPATAVGAGPHTVSYSSTGAKDVSLTVTEGGTDVESKTGYVTILADNSLTLSSGASSAAQTVCVHTTISNIVYSTTGTTGVTITGLPAGIATNWTSPTATISGSPTAAGTFAYTVTTAGSCGTATATGSITVLLVGAPEHLTYMRLTDSTFTLTWQNPNPVGVVSLYEIYRNGQLIDSVYSDSANIQGLSSWKVYSMNVLAVDHFGNRSSLSETLRVKTLDTQKPTPSLSISHDNVTQVSATMFWSASTDNVGVKEYELFERSTGESFGKTSETSMNLTGLTPGKSYTLYVVAYDSAGNVSDHLYADGFTALPNSIRQLSETAYLYPVPAIDQIHVVFTGQYETYAITDMLGKVAMMGKIQSEKALSIDISQLVEGCYILTLNGDKPVIKRFVKVK
jgi:PKD repeat protein